MSVPRTASSLDYTSDEYSIRWYDERDREAFLNLYNLAFSGCTPEWFAWKYEQLPYADFVPIIVAEKDGEIGGFRPVLPLPIQVGNETVMALQLIDLMVHPDHRRQGLMTKMYEWMRDECWDDYAATFTYANEPSRRGMMKMNDERWTHHDLGQFDKYERIHNFTAFTTDEHPPALQFGAKVANPVGTLKLRVQDMLKLTDNDIVVTRHDSVRTDILLEIHERVHTDQPHVRRDAEFYNWRFAEPDTEFVMYSASRNGVREAAIVVGFEQTSEGPMTANLTEILPLAGGFELGAAFSCLLSRITSEFDFVDHISATGNVIPHRILAAHGFARWNSYPLSKFIEPTSFLVCPLGGLDHSQPGIEAALVNPLGWNMSYCERLFG
ncbi:GNAT family N-acetyltransferase [Haladaptatus sp. ZSTT2]|uniref:GNAT family N-acetyltransferase n=1 Tax=Haladaptatus sp. ZSTT2 TaxID=3120515 RepID=UPI00300F72CC